jgi:prepilin-type processing-associated H-X9-DG protein
MDWKKAWNSEENRYLALHKLLFLECPASDPLSARSVFAPTSYIGIAGVGSDAISFASADPNADLFGYDRKLSMYDIGKPTASVLVALETSQTEGAWTAPGRPTVRGLDPTDLPYLGEGRQFGGLHSGGTNAVFLDGSVHCIPNSTDRDVIEALATIKANREIKVDWSQ